MNVAELRRPPEAVLEHVTDGADVIVGVANGEPARILDTIEANADRFRDVRFHIVDRVVTEYGVAELRGSSIRTRRLIAIAHPKFRDELARSAREIGYL